MNIILPKKIKEKDIEPNYMDPKLYGGFKPLGHLIKVSTELYFGVILIFSFSSFLPLFLNMGVVVAPIDDLTVFFGGAYVFGLLSFLSPILWLHNHISVKKEEKKASLDSDIRKTGREEDFYSFPEIRPRDNDEMIEYIQLYLRFDHVDRMKEYPLDFSMTQEFLTISLLPFINPLISYILL
ncbi:hypothetical protein AKJ41_01745 [candidate division MSBL1 archaeon SCGC-AAA259O05]|uniref:Uncharacterized protein n=1 Tax=candidate division MSBL1 archaeon SCGC-AAA259O05 TaxID=1698271 RepID=A0A133V4I8_9EURY|nr:hypothetical protein AKJ41_01745 [candidate division MSBL1 archaeon SCGC-AAA259O05]